MKQFLHKIVKLIIIPMIIFGLSFLGFVLVVSNISSPPELNQNITEIYIGDSHIRHSIDDSIIENGKNVALNSESYYFSYYKLKQILGNEEIRNVTLGFSYHNLSSYYDRFIFGDYSKSVSPPYFYILPFKEQLKLIFINGTDFHFVVDLIKIGFKMLLSKDKPYIGNFINRFSNTSAVKSSMDKRIDFQYYNDGKLNGFSELNLEYLEKIIHLCNKNKVKLSLMNTPLFDYYESKVPEEFKTKLQYFIDNNQINHIDLSKELTSKIYFIPDGDHLSSDGANILSKKLNILRRPQKEL